MWLNVIRDVQRETKYLLYPFYFYANLVAQYQMFYGTRAKCYEPVTVHRPHWHRFSDWISLIFGLTCLAKLSIAHHLDKFVFFRVFDALMPKFGKHYMMVALVTWTITRLLFLKWALLSTRLSYYNFVAILVVTDRPCEGITPKQIGLNTTQYRKLAKVRQRLLQLVTWVNMVVLVFAAASRLKGSIAIGAWHRHPPLMFLWYALYLIWAWHILGFIYGLPVFVTLVTYYLWLKRCVIHSKITRLNQNLREHCSQNNTKMKIKNDECKTMNEFSSKLSHTAMRINSQYTRLLGEANWYNHVLSRCLTIIVIEYTLIMVYSIYLIFITKIPPALRVTYTIILITHIVFLLLLIYGCSSIAQSGPRLGIEIIRFQFQCNSQRFLSPRVLFKLDNMTQEIMHKPMGFTVINGHYIKRRTFFTIFYVVSRQFFLLFKRNASAQSL